MEELERNSHDTMFVIISDLHLDQPIVSSFSWIDRNRVCFHKRTFSHLFIYYSYIATNLQNLLFKLIIIVYLTRLWNIWLKFFKDLKTYS
jgi:hypothetical protein